MMGRLSEELATGILHLKTAVGLTQVDESYEPSHFGDGSLTLAGPVFSVRILRDRGQIFVELAGKQGEWADATELLQIAGVYPNQSSPPSEQELLRLIAAHADELASVLQE